jgi:hypothetical protein
MGCWCETCGITQLPINAGNKCRAFLIVKQDYGEGEHGGGHCYANDVWYPRGFGVLGDYNDYGGIENIQEDICTQVLLNGLKQDFVPYKAKNQWEQDENPQDLTIELVLDSAERNRAQVYDGESPIEAKRLNDMYDHLRNNREASSIDINAPHEEDRTPKVLGVMFVLEDVYQALLTHDPISAHHTDNGYLYRKRSEILADDLKDWYVNGLTKAQTLYKELGNNRSLGSMLLDSVSHWNVFSSHRADPPFCKGISYYYDFLKEKMVQGVPYEDPEVQTVAQGLIDFTKFQWAISECRRAWSPQSGKGSQQNETEIYKVLSNTVLEICATEDAKRAEWDDGVDWKAKHNEEVLAARAKEDSNV